MIMAPPCRLQMFCLLLCLLCLARPVSSTIRVDSQTNSGYDTELGSDAICWLTWARDPEEGGEELPSDLFEKQSFYTEGIVRLQSNCPSGNNVTPHPPKEFEQEGFRPRTLTYYDYSVQVQLDLTTLVQRLSELSGTTLPSDTSFVSDLGPVVAVQVLGCVIDAGFCSPFIHEAANKRLASLGLPTSPANKGDRHGDTHTHSGYQFHQVPLNEGPTYDFNITVPMLVNDPGEYYMVVSAQMYLGDPTNLTLAGDVPLAPDVLARMDIGRAFESDGQNSRIVHYQAPPEILIVDDWVLIISYVIIGISSSVILYLLVETIRYRDHQVLKLTQGYFLMAFLISALVASVCSFLFEPKNDAYCNSVYPIVLICLQLMYAIMIGRLWRINAVISPLLMQTLRQKNTWQSRLFHYLRTWSLCGMGDSNKPTAMRRKITDVQLASVILLFAFPQVILQVLRIILQPLEATVDFNADEGKGREVCDPTVLPRANLIYYGFYYFILSVVLLLGTSQATRSLPSLFNETKSIFDSALSTLVLLVLGLAIIFMTDDPTVTPAVTYIVYVAWTLSMCLNMSLRVMLPKLRLVWRKEVVLVSKLVSDHAQSVRRDNEQYTNSFNVSGLAPTSSGPGQWRPHQHQLSDVTSSGNYPSTAHSNSQEVMEHLDDAKCDGDEDHTGGIMKLDGTSNRDMTDTEVTMNEPVDAGEEQADGGMVEIGAALTSDEPDPASHISYATQVPLSKLKSARKVTIQPKKPQSGRRRKGQHLSNRILVRTDEAPARRLVLKMIDLQNELSTINERIMSGLAASEDDWRSVVKLVSRLDRTFDEEVRFAWDYDGSSDMLRDEKLEKIESMRSVQEELEKEELVALKSASTSNLMNTGSKKSAMNKAASQPMMELSGAEMGDESTTSRLLAEQTQGEGGPNDVV